MTLVTGPYGEEVTLTRRLAWSLIGLHRRFIVWVAERMLPLLSTHKGKWP